MLSIPYTNELRRTDIYRCFGTKYSWNPLNRVTWRRVAECRPEETMGARKDKTSGEVTLVTSLRPTRLAQTSYAAGERRCCLALSTLARA